MLAFDIWAAPAGAESPATRTIQRDIDTAALSDQLRLDLESALSGATPSGFLAVLARSLETSEATPGDTGPVGLAYAQASRAHDADMIEVVGPVSRLRTRVAEDRLSDIASETLRTAVAAHDLDDTSRPLRLWVDEGDERLRSTAAELDFTLERELIQMGVDLPVDRGATAPIDTRPFDPQSDVEAWLSVNNRSFAEHGEQGGWDAADLRQRIDEPWFDPRGFLVLDGDNGAIIGFCWTKMHSPSGGEIYVVGVDPDHAGKGLGRRLTLAGLDAIAGRGGSRATLWVDGDNEAALSMYARLGFAPILTRRALRREPPR